MPTLPPESLMRYVSYKAVNCNKILDTFMITFVLHSKYVFVSH